MLSKAYLDAIIVRWMLRTGSYQTLDFIEHERNSKHAKAFHVNSSTALFRYKKFFIPILIKKNFLIF